jgi:hypothetical protein
MEIMLVRTPQAIHRIPCDLENKIRNACDLENKIRNAYDQELNKIKQLCMD